MILSIITINWNNAQGLERTIRSVVSQNYKDFEYLIIDGGSTDGSVDIIKKYASSFHINWVSEPDKGIYNAMNKGILKASGEYLHFLNSGDMLYDDNVVAQMVEMIEKYKHPAMLTGYMYLQMPDGSLKKKAIGDNYSFIRFYTTSINHPATYIKRELFDKFGLYDESLKIVSDWKWFTQVVAFNRKFPRIVHVNVSIFDLTGISTVNEQLRLDERKAVLKDIVPQCFLSDYEHYTKDIFLMARIRQHKWAFNLVKCIDKLVSLIEKRKKRK